MPWTSHPSNWSRDRRTKRHDQHTLFGWYAAGPYPIRVHYDGKLHLLVAVVRAHTVTARERRMSKIVNYWQLSPTEQEYIISNNPVTSCSHCGKEEILLVSCYVCGEDVCFACAVPCATLGITRDGGYVDADDIVLCKKCGVF